MLPPEMGYTYRDSQAGICRVKDLGIFIPKWISPSNLSLRAHGILQKSKEKGCKSLREWRTPRNKGTLNQHAQSSYELAKSAAARIGPPCLCYGFQFSDFMGFLSVKMNGSLTLVPSLGLFSFCWLVLYNFYVIVFVLPCYILFYFFNKIMNVYKFSH